MKLGKYKQQKSSKFKNYQAFIPAKFPPKGGFEFGEKTQQLNDKAVLNLGKLDGITQLLPDLDFFIFMYVRKEAVYSSQIEGTEATLKDAIKAGAKIDKDLPEDVDNILQYIKAMNYSLERFKELPLSLRFIREAHKEIMEGSYDEPGSRPGEFRKSQNWISGTNPNDAEYVPPPVHKMKDSLYDLEKFMHEEEQFTPLVKTALIHSQFETIHPFLDGNGRTGRLLTTIYLCQRNILEKPVLYLSEYFKKHRELYFEKIKNYHDKDEVEEWVNFFLKGVSEVSQEAVETSKAINELRKDMRKRIKKVSKTRKVRDRADKVVEKLYELPIVDVKTVRGWLGDVTRQTVNNLVEKMVKADILDQIDKEEEYARTFQFTDYLKLFTNNDN